VVSRPRFRGGNNWPPRAVTAKIAAAWSEGVFGTLFQLLRSSRGHAHGSSFRFAGRHGLASCSTDAASGHRQVAVESLRDDLDHLHLVVLVLMGLVAGIATINAFGVYSRRVGEVIARSGVQRAGSFTFSQFFEVQKDEEQHIKDRCYRRL
jgi:hypothetical protein